MVFLHGRVLASIDDDDGRAAARVPPRDEAIRERMTASLERAAGCRRGEFSFQVSANPPRIIGGRDIAAQTLRAGVDVIELLIDLVCRQERDEGSLGGAAHRKPRAASGGGFTPP